MEIKLEKLASDEAVLLTAKLAAKFGTTAWLVGGGVRDCLLGRQLHDLDFALDGAFTGLPRRFAQQWGGTFFWLDEERLQARVVKKAAGEILVCDFAPLRSATIEADLRLRDFTINALALPVCGSRNGLIDPLAGACDLGKRLIRACAATSFDDDPLRLLRAVRFGAELGFDIEARTWHSLREKSALAGNVAAERVREEMFRILAAPGIGTSLTRLEESGLLRSIFRGLTVLPETGLGVAAAVAVERVCGNISRLFPDAAARLILYLESEVEGGIAMASLMKLAALCGQPERTTLPLLAENLRLGRKAEKVLRLLLGDEQELFGMLEQAGTDRAIYRFFRDREPAGPALVLLALAGGAISVPAASRLLDYYLEDYDLTDGDLFLSGVDIMGIAGIGAGKRVGEVMDELRNAESRSLVTDREAAVRFVKNLLTKGEPVR
jgi:poly(A) polymerase